MKKTIYMSLWSLSVCIPALICAMDVPSTDAAARVTQLEMQNRALKAQLRAIDLYCKETAVLMSEPNQPNPGRRNAAIEELLTQLKNDQEAIQKAPNTVMSITAFGKFVLSYTCVLNDIMNHADKVQSEDGQTLAVLQRQLEPS